MGGRPLEIAARRWTCWARKCRLPRINTQNGRRLSVWPYSERESRPEPTCFEPGVLGELDCLRVPSFLNQLLSLLSLIWCGPVVFSSSQPRQR